MPFEVCISNITWRICQKGICHNDGTTWHIHRVFIKNIE